MTLIELINVIVCVGLGVLAGFALRWLTSLDLYIAIPLMVIAFYGAFLLLVSRLNRTVE